MLSLLKSEAIRKEFFERFYINKQNVVQASHYIYGVMKSKNKPSIVNIYGILNRDKTYP